ncbi:hypothetical protein [Streptomyces sp. NPDC017991]|uniref:hypothetical protein n=1 Tax=Streptomyces sp. NPDC017991 TaxID=3365026 RepID=UPI0037988A8C
MSTKTFEDRLLDELKREITLRADELPAPAPRRRVAPRRAVIALAASTAVAGALIALPSATGGSSAYAIERQPDGSIVLNMLDQVGLFEEDQQKELAERLRAEGIHVSIDTPRAGYVCAEPRGRNLLPETMKGSVDGDDSAGEFKVTLHPGDSVAVEDPQPPVKPGVYAVGRVLMFEGPMKPCQEVPFEGATLLP